MGIELHFFFYLYAFLLKNNLVFLNIRQLSQDQFNKTVFVFVFFPKHIQKVHDI